jgi:hypothetical protein
VEQVGANGIAYADCEDLAPAVAAEDQVRFGIESQPYAYKPREGLFHVVVARPVDAKFSGRSFPEAMGAPQVRGYTTEDPSAAAGMLDSALFGGVGKPEAQMRNPQAQYGGLSQILGSFARGVAGGPVSATGVAGSLGQEMRKRIGIEDDFARNIGKSLAGPSAEQAGIPIDDEDGDDSDVLTQAELEAFGGGGALGNVGSFIMRSFVNASVNAATQRGFDALVESAGGEKRLARLVRQYKRTGDKRKLEKIRRTAERIQGRRVDWDEVNQLVAMMDDEAAPMVHEEDVFGASPAQVMRRYKRRQRGARKASRQDDSDEFGFGVNRTMLEMTAESLRREIDKTPRGPGRRALKQRLAYFEELLEDHVQGADELPVPFEAHLPQEDDELSVFEEEEDFQLLGTEPNVYGAFWHKKEKRKKITRKKLIEAIDEGNEKKIERLANRFRRLGGNPDRLIARRSSSKGAALAAASIPGVAGGLSSAAVREGDYGALLSRSEMVDPEFDPDSDFDMEDLDAFLEDDEDDEFGAYLMDSTYSTGIYKHLQRDPIDYLAYPLTDAEEDDVASAIAAEHFGFDSGTNWDAVMYEAETTHQERKNPAARGWDVPGQNAPVSDRSVRQLSKPIASADSGVELSGFGAVHATDLDIQEGFADWVEDNL